MKTQLSPEQVSELGREWYNSKIKRELSDDQLGMDLAIEVTTGEYEIGNSGIDVTEKLHERIKDAEVYLMKHGSFVTMSLGFHPDVDMNDDHNWAR